MTQSLNTVSTLAFRNMGLQDPDKDFTQYYASRTYANGWTASVMRLDTSDDRIIYEVATKLGATLTENSIFGPVRGNLSTEQANFALAEIASLPKPSMVS